MKRLACCLLLLAFIPCLPADELLHNGDFSQGLERWHGDLPVNSGDDSLSLDAPAPNPAATSAGLTLTLKPDRWIKVFQEFVGHSDKLTITIQYKLSSDATFSDKDSDYKNVTDSIGYDGWKPFQIPPQTWCLMISDFGPDKGRYFMIKPTFNVADVQNVTANMPGKDSEKKTFTIAFPPGTGTVTLLKVSVSD